MKYLRYRLSSLFLQMGIALVPDEYPRNSLRMGISFAAEMMLNELNDEDLGEDDLGG